jgi:MazG family protein
MSTALPGLQKLIETVRALRDPTNGCPWDRAQTHASLKPYALEEVHEFVDSLDKQGADSPETWEELGDVLFQVVLHSQLLSERKLTHLDAIAGNTAAKLIQRHPHVFDPQAPKFKTPEEVNKAWEQLKAQKKKDQPPQSRTQRISNVPKSLPALQRAARIGEKAASLGFDWKNPSDVLAKVREEAQELAEAKGETHAQEECGDLLFAIAQYARKKKWDPEALLTQASQKFLGRFERLEKAVEAAHQDWDKLSIEELDAHWNAIKHQPK